MENIKQHNYRARNRRRRHRGEEILQQQKRRLLPATTKKNRERSKQRERDRGKKNREGRNKRKETEHQFEFFQPHFNLFLSFRRVIGAHSAGFRETGNHFFIAGEALQHLRPAGPGPDPRTGSEYFSSSEASFAAPPPPSDSPATERPIPVVGLAVRHRFGLP